MIVDSSAIAAILFEEPERTAFALAMSAAATCRVSAGSWVELAVVLTRRSDGNPADLDFVRHKFRIVIEPVTASQAEIAREAYRNYGQFSGSKAHLNFGDCFAYALAKEKGEPLLYKGDDFVHTDIVSAV